MTAPGCVGSNLPGLKLPDAPALPRRLRCVVCGRVVAARYDYMLRVQVAAPHKCEQPERPCCG